MADTTISSLNTVNALSATNYIPISDGTDTTKLGTDSLFGLRNYIINGDFRVDQRNGGGSVLVNTGGPSVWTGPDRFFSYQNSPSTNVSIQRQSVDVPVGFANALKWGRSGSGTPGGVTVLATALETDQSIPLAGKTVTLSFYAKKGANFSSLNSQLEVILISGTGVDQGRGEMVTFAWSGVARPIETAVTLASSWQRFTLTGTVAANSKQLGLYFSWTTTGVAGVDDNAYISGVQLEEGPTSTPFERRFIGTELMLCQRYFQKTYRQDVTPGTAVATQNAVSHIYGAGAFQNIWWRLPVTMRTIPSPTAYNPNTGAIGTVFNSSNNVSYDIVFNSQYPYTSDSLVVGRTSINQTVQNEINVHFTANAEL